MVITTNKRSGEKVALAVHELNVRSVDRGRKDIANWQAAQIAAESVYYPNRSRLYDLYKTWAC